MRTLLSLLLGLTLASADKEPVWDVQQSSNVDGATDDLFLNVPVYYGDWVPITNAKNTIKAVATSIALAQQQHHQPQQHPEVAPLDRVDTISSPVFVGPKQPPQRPQRPQAHRHRQQHQRRRKDRVNNNRRRHRKITQKKQPSFVEKITSFFTGGGDLETSPSNHPQPVQQPHPQPVIGPNLPKPTASVPTPTSDSFSFFHLPNILRGQQKPRKRQPVRNHHHHHPHHDVPKPVIKLVEAPDLAPVSSTARMHLQYWANIGHKKQLQKTKHSRKSKGVNFSIFNATKVNFDEEKRRRIKRKYCAVRSL